MSGRALVSTRSDATVVGVSVRIGIELLILPF